MKVLGIIGSPRTGGNTDILLDKTLEGACQNGAQTEKIILNKLKFVPCQECDNVRDDGACIINDDMQGVYKKIKEADALVLASPIFFGSLSAQAKMMIDRFQCIWRAKYILKKDIGFKKIKGIFLAVEGSDRKEFFENARSIVKIFFAVINIEYYGELFCSKVDGRSDIMNRKDCLERAYEIGLNLTK